MAATITEVYQDVTSHVNLKSKERGTPNMMCRDFGTSYLEFSNQPVHLVVEKDKFTITLTTDIIVKV